MGRFLLYFLKHEWTKLQQDGLIDDDEAHEWAAPGENQQPRIRADSEWYDVVRHLRKKRWDYYARAKQNLLDKCEAEGNRGDPRPETVNNGYRSSNDDVDILEDDLSEEDEEANHGERNNAKTKPKSLTRPRDPHSQSNSPGSERSFRRSKSRSRQRGRAKENERSQATTSRRRSSSGSRSKRVRDRSHEREERRSKPTYDKGSQRNHVRYRLRDRSNSRSSRRSTSHGRNRRDIRSSSYSPRRLSHRATHHSENYHRSRYSSKPELRSKLSQSIHHLSRLVVDKRTRDTILSQQITDFGEDVDAETCIELNEKTILEYELLGSSAWAINVEHSSRRFRIHPFESGPVILSPDMNWDIFSRRLRETFTRAESVRVGLKHLVSTRLSPHESNVNRWTNAFEGNLLSLEEDARRKPGFVAVILLSTKLCDELADRLMKKIELERGRFTLSEAIRMVKRDPEQIRSNKEREQGRRNRKRERTSNRDGNSSQSRRKGEGNSRSSDKSQTNGDQSHTIRSAEHNQDETARASYNPRCYNCNERGHLSRDCPKKKRSANGPPHPQAKRAKVVSDPADNRSMHYEDEGKHCGAI